MKRHEKQQQRRVTKRPKREYLTRAQQLACLFPGALIDIIEAFCGDFPQHTLKTVACLHLPSTHASLIFTDGVMAVVRICAGRDMARLVALDCATSAELWCTTFYNWIDFFTTKSANFLYAAVGVGDTQTAYSLVQIDLKDGKKCDIHRLQPNASVLRVFGREIKEKLLICEYTQNERGRRLLTREPFSIPVRAQESGQYGTEYTRIPHSPELFSCGTFAQIWWGRNAALVVAEVPVKCSNEHINAH